MISTREYQSSDLDNVSRLFDAYRQFYEQPPDLDLARRFIQARTGNRESIVLLAHDATNQIVGFCQLYPTFCSVAAAPIYVLYDLFVAPSARRAGVARELLLAAASRGRTDGKVRMDLATAKTNVKAQSLYEALGWQRDDLFYTYSLALGQ